VLPLAFLALLVAVEARHLDSLKDANWWLVDNLRTALLFPLVAYVFMTLMLRSERPKWRDFLFAALLVLLTPCVALFFPILAYGHFPLYLASG
jgi:uncharacterized membrane protein SirB2